MAITLRVSDVRAEIYRAAGGAQSAGAGEASTALLGQIFHEAFASLVGPDESKNFRAALNEVEPGQHKCCWQAALVAHTYRHLVGPRLWHNQAALHRCADRVLTFWDAVQEMCGWLAELLWQAREHGVMVGEEVLTAEQPLRWELREPEWTEAVALVGVADAVWRIPETGQWCVIELKTGRTASEADLAQACLYHQMLAASGLNSEGTLAVVSFEPQKRERLFSAAQLAEVQQHLRQLIGKLAGVLPNKNRVSLPSDDYCRLGQQLEAAFAEYGAEIRAGTPTVGPTFLRFPIELGRRVTLNSLRQRVEEVQARLGLEAPPRVSLEGGRLAIDLQRPDRQFVYFSQIRAQLPPRDELLGNARVPVGVDLSGKVRLVDFAEETAHLLLAGTTGSGKSEWLRTAVAGLLVTNTPDTLCLALADPKRNAFQLLRQSPFLYREIAYDEEAVLGLLDALGAEMESRYEQMARINADTLSDLIRRTGRRLPRIFFFCDEYAYLMTGERRVRQELERLIKRLGYKARAAGIHLILATQQPSRQVVAGPIRSNIDARVGLRMPAIESRILLGEAGTEALLGKGDLLYKCIGETVRLQSAYLLPEELAQVFGEAAGSNYIAIP